MSQLKIREIRTGTYPIETRIPFRFGNAELRRIPHLGLRLTLERDGKSEYGFAADHLMTKWFSKTPGFSDAEEMARMEDVVATACRIAQNASAAPTPFQLWWDIYHEQHRQGAKKGWPELLTSFGATFIERALVEAFCRLEKKPFAQAVREKGLGLELGRIHPELAGRAAISYLPPKPLTRTAIRHTVGLSDPLTDEEARQASPPDDGLPVSLAEYIRTDGVSWFKIKIAADSEKNIARLESIAALLERLLPGAHQFTLDGNESYRDVADFRQFWETLVRNPRLQGFLDRLVFVEQPLARDTVFEADLREAFRGCARPPHLIIDESDAALDALPRALKRGYEGTSHKNCKGIFKSIANLALLKQRAADSNEPWLFSGEDLTNIGPIALPQDVCVAQVLGIPHLERNGHHYFRGLPDFSRPNWKDVLRLHGDLYAELTDGRPCLRIKDGFIDCPSLHQRGLGLLFDPDSSLFQREA